MPRGKVNPISVLLLLGFAAGGWWLYVYGPIYWDNLEVKDELGKCAAQAAVDGDDTAASSVLRRLNGTVGWHYRVDPETGEESVAPGLGLEKDQLEVKSDSSTKLVTARVEYDRTFQLVPFQRRKTLHFVVLRQGRLQ
jgi:hypothetical protein